MNNKPLIFDIARASLEDGKGIRTVVFLKGCLLRCLWCHNPESWNFESEIMYYPERCINCGRCEEGCYSRTREKAGLYWQKDDLIKEILKDKIFYETSGGGVTFSGGEPLLWPEYLHEIIRELKDNNVNIDIETSGYFEYKSIPDDFFKKIDTVYFDLKVMKDMLHKKYTGKSNKQIHDNLFRLLEKGCDVVPGIVLVPELVANEKNLYAAAKFIKRNGFKKYRLLTYNNSYSDKYKKLGKAEKSNKILSPMSLDEEIKWKKYFKDTIESL